MKKTKSFMAFCIAMPLAVAVAGCGAGTTDSKKESSTEQPSKPLDLSIMLPQQAAPIPQPDSPVIKALEQYTNTTLHFQWVPANDYNTKLNAVLASGEVPKLVFSKYTPTIIDAMKSGMFWEIGPYLKEYKNIAKMNPGYFSNIAVNGKEYGMPSTRAMGRGVILYRKDWADELGIQAPPKSLDEWLTVLRASVKAHPGTFGITDKKDMTNFNYFVVMNGGYNGWGVNNGTLQPDFMGPGYMDVLKFYRTLYKEKLINQDFPTSTGTPSLFNAGKAAWMTDVASNAESNQNAVVKVDPKAVVEMAPMTGSAGYRVQATSGNNGFVMVPKSAVKTEAELKQILNFYDKLLDPQMANLMAYGIEGKDYKVENGKAVMIDKENYDNTVSALNNGLPTDHATGNEMATQASPMQEKINKITKENDNHLIQDPTLTLTSDTYVKKGNDLKQMILTANLKFILGEIDENGWNQAVDQWKKAGGDQMITEYTASYKSSQSK